MILRMQSLGTQVKRPLSFQPGPSPRIRGTQPLGSSSNIYYHLFLTWTLHNLCHFPATQPPSASVIQLLKVAAGVHASSMTDTQCVQHAVETTQGRVRFISVPWTALGSCITHPTQLKLAKNYLQMKESMNVHIYSTLLIYTKENTAHSKPDHRGREYFIIWSTLAAEDKHTCYFQPSYISILKFHHRRNPCHNLSQPPKCWPAPKKAPHWAGSSPLCCPTYWC